MTNESAARVLSSLSGMGWSSILMNEDVARMAVKAAVFRRDNPKTWNDRITAELVFQVDEAIEHLGLQRFI